MVEKYKLNLTVALIILLVSIWLIRGLRMWASVGHLLQGCSIAIIIWTFLKKEEKAANLFEFFGMSLVISIVITGSIWFVSVSIVSPTYFLRMFLLPAYDLGVILTRSLLPLAISVIIFGIFRTKLEAWEFFLSSWYTSIFVVFGVYEVWWTILVQPYVSHFHYSAAGALVRDLLFVGLAFLIAGLLTIVYAVVKEPETETRP